VRGELPEPGARNISGTFFNHETNMTSVAAVKKKPLLGLRLLENAIRLRSVTSRH
jgi:hypothetical protein